jgi:hypothetical protein
MSFPKGLIGQTAMHSSRVRLRIPANIEGARARKSRPADKKNPDVLANDPGKSGRTGGGIALSSAVGYV